MPRVFRTIGVSMPPELVEYVQEVAKDLYNGNRSIIFREGLYFALWNIETAIEEVLKARKEGKDPEEEAINRDDAVSYYMLMLADLPTNKLNKLLKKTKLTKRKLERELYYV